MPLTADSILQSDVGAAASAASINVTLPAGTADGSSVIVVLSAANSAGSSGLAAAGFVIDYDGGALGGARDIICRKPVTTAGETTWTFTVTISAQAWSWCVLEVEGLDQIQPYEGAAGSSATPTAAGATVTVSSPTANASNGMDTLAVCLFANKSASTSGAGSWDAATVTGGFDVQGQAQLTNAYGLMVATRVSGGATLGPFATSAAYTAPAGTANDFPSAHIFIYRSADSPTVNPMGMICGFEHGHAYGTEWLGGGTRVPFRVTGTPGTDVLVQASSARAAPSAFGCRVIATAANRNIYFEGDLQLPAIATLDPLVVGFDARVVSGAGTVVVAEIVAPASKGGVGNSLQLVYDVTATRFGVRWGAAGTVTWQAGTRALNTWTWVSLRVSGFKAGTRTAEWSIETAAGTYTTQTAASSTEPGGANASTIYLGGGATATQTSTTDLDNVLASTFYSAFPAVPHTMRVLKADPAGVPTVNGTVGNFALVTNNATGAALTAGTLAAAQAAIDEGPPPTISAASDGVVQTTTAATNYIQFPMDTFTIGAAEVVAGVRIYACLISTTGAGTGTFDIRGWDGTTETSNAWVSPNVAIGSSTVLSTTAPPWVATMWTPTGKLWTQARLDAAALRMGYSTDATPDLGVHAMYLEVATRPTLTARQISIEDDAFTVDLVLSPYSSASVAYLMASNDPTRGATLAYTVTGVPQTPVYVSPGTSATVSVQVDAFGDVSDLTLTPDPAP
jgi:hypothetical protein